LRHPFYGLTLKPEDKVRILKEIYTLSSKTEGGFPHDQVYSMPVYMRYFYLKMLVDEKERESKALKQAEGNTPGSTMSKAPTSKRVNKPF
jgi:hypothetical protein